MQITREKLLDNKLSDKQDNKRVKRKRRIITLVTLLGSVLISAIFWLRSKRLNWFEGFQQPFVYEVTKNSSKVAKDTSGFKNKEDVLYSLDSLVSELRGVYGVYYFNLQKDIELGFNENEVFTAASVNKVPIMVAFYQEVEVERLKEEGEYFLQKQDVQDYGTGQMRYQSLGTKYFYRELVELSGKISDNTAAYVLEKIIGRSKIQSTLNKLGATNTLLADNITTPKEMGNFFAALYEGSLLKERNKEKIFAALIDTAFEDRIPKGVPENIRVVHKIGNEIQTYNDCGIVFAENPYVLCILTKEVSEDEALDALPKISKIFWQFNKND